jgi:hypothetical protein
MTDDECATYCVGPRLVVDTKRNITSRTILDIITHLRIVFGPGYEFEPEDATEAGIVWVEYPGKTKRSYKSFRFHFYTAGGWPVLNDERLDEWVHGERPEILWKFSDRRTDKEREEPIGSSTLKAFYGAPAWTVKEVNLFRNAFRQHGVDSLSGPTAAALKASARK